MRFSDAIERVFACTSRTELIDAVTIGAGEVVPTDGVRVAALQMAPEVRYRVLAQRQPAPDPSPTIVRSPMGHPIVAAYVATRFPGWVSVQDLLPGREWLRHPLYREVYRPLGLNAHISCALRDTGAAMHSLSLNRAGRDFSDRERDRLEEYRRLVRLAWRQLEDRAALRAALSSVGRGTADQPILVLTADPMTPRVVACTEAMARLLTADPALLGVLQNAALTGSDVVAPVVSAGTALQVTLQRSADAVVVRAAEVRPSPLTAREQQVLAALAGGGPAHAIGHELGISERTVHKHLENIYAKLGVHDRLEAVLLTQRVGTA